jgi:hypothetical protein
MPAACIAATNNARSTSRLALRSELGRAPEGGGDRSQSTVWPATVASQVPRHTWHTGYYAAC